MRRISSGTEVHSGRNTALDGRVKVVEPKVRRPFDGSVNGVQCALVAVDEVVVAIASSLLKICRPSIMI